MSSDLILTQIIFLVNLFYFIFLFCLVCWQYCKEIRSIVIQSAFGNPTLLYRGYCQLVLLVSCVIIVSFEQNEMK